jgi:hypothetical protein
MNLYDLGVKIAYDSQLESQLKDEVADVEKPNYALRKLPGYLYDQLRDQAAFLKLDPGEIPAGEQLGRFGRLKNWAARGVNPAGTALEALAILTPGDHYRGSMNNPVAENNMQRPAAFLAKYAPLLGKKFPAIAPLANAVGSAAKPFDQTGGFVNAYRYLRHDVADAPVRSLLRKIPWLNSRIGEVSKVPEAMRGAQSFGLGKLPTAGLAAYGSYTLGDLAYTTSEIAQGKQNLYDDTVRQSGQGLLTNIGENLQRPGAAVMRYFSDDGKLNPAAASNLLLGPVPSVVSKLTEEYMRSRNLDEQLRAVKQRGQLKSILPNILQSGKGLATTLARTGDSLKRLLPK